MVIVYMFLVTRCSYISDLSVVSSLQILSKLKKKELYMDLVGMLHKSHKLKFLFLFLILDYLNRLI